MSTEDALKLIDHKVDVLTRLRVSWLTSSKDKEKWDINYEGGIQQARIMTQRL